MQATTFFACMEGNEAVNSAGNRIVNDFKTITELENRVESEGATLTTLAQTERMRKKTLKWILKHLNSCIQRLISMAPQLRLEGKTGLK